MKTWVFIYVKKFTNDWKFIDDFNAILSIDWKNVVAVTKLKLDWELLCFSTGWLAIVWNRFIDSKTFINLKKKKKKKKNSMIEELTPLHVSW